MSQWRKINNKRGFRIWNDEITQIEQVSLKWRQKIEQTRWHQVLLQDGTLEHSREEDGSNTSVIYMTYGGEKEAFKGRFTHSMPCPCRSLPCRRETAVLCRGLEKNGMIRAWYGRGMASVNQARPHCVNQMGKTHSKPLAARHACLNRPLGAKRAKQRRLSPTLS